MKQKGLNKMTNQMLKDVEKIRRGFELGSRVGVTQLGRSTQWRDDLERLTAMEVVDRNQTAAVLLKPESFKALMTYLDQVEQELEQEQVEAIFAYRKDSNDWSSGEDLATKAKASLEERQRYIRGLLDDDRQ
ncbi:exonuclease VII small subunit [Virgibacillus natechei]|uniref:Exonuclease VII small subunit n=1 Tax=Virgibacillus natechei TaxID=1216297 RepID=A0ABS4IJZ1_9BACI|nr:hypothetical protein [Virgibacillus natechei]MBP1970329.1 exonuclease VII small subunit [Virgibacillus natechei]UZD13156.1 hypothetical protein OLD84_00830 [Virgibacillus natechei]